MIKQINLNDEGDAYLPFEVQTSFIVMANHNGVIPSNETYDIEMLPRVLPAGTTGYWTKAPGASTLQDETKATVVNGSPGFHYRIRRTDTATVNPNITFYWDHVTTLGAFYNN